MAGSAVERVSSEAPGWEHAWLVGGLARIQDSRRE